MAMHEKNREGFVPDDEAVQCTPSHLLPSYGLTLKHIAEKIIRSHVTMGDTFLKWRLPSNKKPSQEPKRLAAAQVASLFARGP